MDPWSAWHVQVYSSAVGGSVLQVALPGSAEPTSFLLQDVVVRDSVVQASVVGPGSALEIIGGAVYVFGGRGPGAITVSVSGCSFINNTVSIAYNATNYPYGNRAVPSGGGLCVFVDAADVNGPGAATNITVVDTVADGNRLVGGTNEVWGGDGGGLFLNIAGGQETSSNTITVSGVTLTNNVACGSGGGLFASIGGSTINNSTVMIHNVTASGNLAGGLFSAYVPPSPPPAPTGPSRPTVFPQRTNSVPNP